ncbi:MAG: FecR domain-containing protein [Saprospiraceae bacterium]|nr:FecR domain-containing protein [Saprospiraceae bacterium]
MSRLEDKILDFIVAGRSVQSEPLDKDILNDPAFDQDLFDEYKQIWDLSDGLRDYKQANLDEAWQAIALEAAIEEEEKDEAKQVPLWRRLSIAASFLILIGSALYFFWPREDYITTPIAEVNTQVELPDGSVAELQPGSSIRFLKETKFLEDTARVVFLTGEAEFNVEPDPGKPFRVETELTSIDVLGTMFRYKVEGRYSEAENKEGLVEFGVKADGQKQIMNEGDVVKYPGEGKIEFIEWKPVPPPPPTNNIRLIDLIQVFGEKYYETLIMEPSVYRASGIVVKVNLNGDLESILQDLQQNENVQIEYGLYRGRTGYRQLSSISATDIGLSADYTYENFLAGKRFKTQEEINQETGYVEGEGYKEE